jgi:diguanylate cyclase (GGDEF)-like protein
MPAPAWDQTRGPETMARWLAVFFLGGSTIALASLAVPHWHNTNTAGTAITALCGYPAAAILFRLGPRLRPAMFHVLLATGSAIISLGVYFQRNSLGAITSAVFYIWVALYGYNFFSRRVASAHVGLAGIGYGIVLWINHTDGGVAQWVLVMGTVVVTGLVVSALVEEVRVVARRDALTGLLNRGAFEDELEREVAFAAREQWPLTIAIIDLDDFKVWNDSYGHQAGDALLRQTAAVWTDQLRPRDRLGRYGGDEFALVLPKTSAEEAQVIVQRLRATVPEGAGFSAGLAQCLPGETCNELVGRADAALYVTKRKRHQPGSRELYA